MSQNKVHFSSFTEMKISEIQELVGDAVNNLVKYFYKPEKEASIFLALYVTFKLNSILYKIFPVE